MARGTPRGAEKAELVAEIERLRDQLDADLHALGHSADVPTRIRQYLASNPSHVAAGSAAIGLLGSIFLRRPTGKRDADNQLRTLVARALRLARSERRTANTTDGDELFSRLAKAFLRSWK